MAIVREDEVSCQGVEGKGEDGRKKYCLSGVSQSVGERWEECNGPSK